MIWTTRPRSRTGPIAAISQGKGPPVLLVHGVGLRAEAWAGQIDALATSRQVIAVDMPGHGDSAALGPDPTLADYIDAIVAVLDAPATVIGHSFGAMIALAMAARHPGMVTGVAALNAIYRRSAPAKAAVRARAHSLDGMTPTDPTVPLMRWFGADASPEQAACHTWLTTVDPAGYRAAYAVFADEDGPADRDLIGLACPALFLTGELEPNSTPAMSHQMAALVPDGQAEIVAQAAHMLPMTHVAEVNRTLAAFLARTA